MNTRQSGRTSTTSLPPGSSTVTGDVHCPVRTSATAVAVAPVPQARVSPTPRSQTLTLASCSPRTLTNSTLTLRGKFLCSSIIGPTSCSGTSSRGHGDWITAVSYTHLRAHETRHDLVCRLLLEKKKINRNRI